VRTQNLLIVIWILLVAALCALSYSQAGAGTGLRCYAWDWEQQRWKPAHCRSNEFGEEDAATQAATPEPVIVWTPTVWEPWSTAEPTAEVNQPTATYTALPYPQPVDWLFWWSGRVR
jgi:hypothetical protein